jgi:tetratricopeptide (TPR) repeat protein
MAKGWLYLEIAAAFLLAAVSPCSRGFCQDADRASKIYADYSKGVFLLIVKSDAGDLVAQGTGFLVPGGRIVTNEHVIRGGHVFVDLGAVRLPVTVERVDSLNDLALLLASGELAAKPLVLSDGLPAPGTPIYTIGNPAGLQRSISTGVVSGVREFKGRQLLQISSPISPGSSGGPVFNAAGEVVGVTVGMLEEGQNLNFAVPSALVRRLVRGGAAASADILSLIDRIDNLTERRSQCEYSKEFNSDWQQIDRQIDEVLQSALDRAGDDPDLLLRVATKAEWQNAEIAVSAAQRAVRAKPTPEANLTLGGNLKNKSLFADEPEKSALLERAERALRSAVRSAKQPSPAMYYHLADVLEDRGSTVEAEVTFRAALESSMAAGDLDIRADSTRGLVRTAYSLGKQSEGAGWFNALVASGRASAWDWEGHGRQLDRQGEFAEAGKSYQQAALLGGVWTNWCEAEASFSLADGAEDSVLACARRCVSEGAGKKNSEGHLALAHVNIAVVLNQRGVYQEALSHAREASALDPSSAWALDAQAEALLGLRRFQEAINAGTQAIRLSDGKYAAMHFRLGSAYSGVENWEFARQSFEKAAQLSPKDDAAAYNVAICLARLGYYSDAAGWYEEVLRRNPGHRDRQEILRRIRLLRQ